MNSVFLFSHKIVIQKCAALIPSFKYYKSIKIQRHFQTAEVGGYLMFYDGDGESYRGRR